MWIFINSFSDTYYVWAACVKTTDLKTEKINTVNNVVKSSENFPKTLKRLNVYG